MRTLTALLSWSFWLSARLTGLSVIGALLTGAAIYVRTHSRPVGVFDPRLTSTARLQEARLGFRQQVLDFQNSLREFKPAELTLTEEQINAVLYADAEYLLGVFGVKVPPEARDVQVAFRPDRMVVRFEYAAPDVGPVMISLSGGPIREPSGAYRTEPGEFHVGRQELPVEVALGEIRDRLRLLSAGAPSSSTPSASTTSSASSSTPSSSAGSAAPTRVGRELLERLAAGEAVGPVLRLPKLPGTRRALLVRLEAFEITEGRLRVRVVPVGFAGDELSGRAEQP